MNLSDFVQAGSPLLAQNAHATMSDLSLLCDQKRTSARPSFGRHTCKGKKHGPADELAISGAVRATI
jgi:hypothetical protein